MTRIHKSGVGTKVFFGKGKFDDWCVFLERPSENAYAPKDTEYFAFFSKLADATSAQTVYRSFQKIYALTTESLDPHVSQVIASEATKYGKHVEEAEVWFAVIYGGMVAEENKAYAKLKKRIKHLGLHQVLMQNFSVSDAANWSRGKPWREIDAECKRFGF
jgi:hypothetical protein